jgi:low affinity Fe/Cu permease
MSASALPANPPSAAQIAGLVAADPRRCGASSPSHRACPCWSAVMKRPSQQGWILNGVSRRENVQDNLRPQGSRVLHLIDRAASRPVVAVVVITADLAWVLVSVVIGFPSRLETTFQTLVAALTLALVFVIQHTSAREQVVVQRKLDEVLKALPKADKTLIALEEGSDAQLSATHQTHRGLRAQAVDEPVLGPDGGIA